MSCPELARGRTETPDLWYGQTQSSEGPRQEAVHRTFGSVNTRVCVCVCVCVCVSGRGGIVYMEGVVGACRRGGVYVCRYKPELPGSMAEKG